MELQSNQNTKSFDYEIKEGLKQKERTTLMFRKYCDYQKYQLFHKLKAALAEIPTAPTKKNEEELKQRIVHQVMDAEYTWSLIFNHLEITLAEGESAELEFRKALYRHKFDRQWYGEISRIENEHYGIMGAILEFTRLNTPDALKVDPLTLPATSTEYKFEIDLPFMRDISDELMMMLCQRFRSKYGTEPSEFEVKH